MEREKDLSCRDDLCDAKFHTAHPPACRDYINSVVRLEMEAGGI